MATKLKEIWLRIKIEMHLAQQRIWSSTFTRTMAVVGLVIVSLGNFLDAKDLISDAWIAGFANLSHKYEYKSLSRVNVGSNLDYIKSYFGPPKLIKKSKFHEKLTFAYYLEEKFILTLILEGERVSAFTITGLDENFIPPIIGRKSTNEESNRIFDNFYEISEFTVDSINVKYFLVEEELGIDKLFLNSFAGMIGYGNNKSFDRSKLKIIYDLAIRELAGSELESAELDERMDNFMQSTENNLYGIGEVELPAIADSILTNYEYSLYYKF